MALELCDPDITQVRSGVLATTPRSHDYRIGVIGRDVAEAREKFASALARWRSVNAERLTIS